MTFIVDTTSSSRRLSGEELRAWAADRTVFISSEMQELVSEREAVAEALRGLGMAVMMFEDIGGRDDDAQTSYLDGVARSDIYLGIVADRYGRMQASGSSPTHDEYRAARERGKTISFWVAADGDGRQRDARDFVQEVQTFHTTGRFDGAADLARRVVERMAEIGADDESPWVKLGDAVFRASVIRDRGDTFEIEARIRDATVANYLEGLRPDQWNRGQERPLTIRDRSGTATIEQVHSEIRSASVRQLTVGGSVSWGRGTGNQLASGTTGFSAEDLVEVGIRVGLLRESIPAELGRMDFMVDGTDPLVELPGDLGHATYAAAARLLVIEGLVGSGRIAAVDDFAIGPKDRDGSRHLSLTYTEIQRYGNESTAQRTVSGIRLGDGTA